ncbi:hypothetical protein M409DRAFT_62136 [Zasmidium cellare ATCC 36951]|uniref:NmrA-like domain-containing protein n=1 Tax=Zasmidium cellare ATCC 36951 TaxID=1080233 RepID=A0A6A6D6G1_ZASCE|nr:uncharacterized protein M409DRAFT_62136 [Zasmidium cellare ATCC 36951]KAF2173920.1 hypothetical protein M409DRAFT_62136 [Zasmidium cellare ATCC 36951]
MQVPSCLSPEMRPCAKSNPYGHHKRQPQWHAEPDPQGSDPWHNITVHKSDFAQPSLTSLFTTVAPDIIFSTQSAGSFSFQKELITTAIQTNIPRFVAAEFGHDTLNPKIQDRLPPYKEKAKVIEYLQEYEKSIEWTAVATGCFPLDHVLITGTLGFDLKWQSAMIPGSGHEKFAASSSSWIGRVAHSIITHWSGVKNQYIYAAGMTVSGHEIMQSLQDQTGQTWEVGNVDVEDLVHEGERRFERGFPDAGMFLMERSVLFDKGLDAVRPSVERDAKEMLGLGVAGESLEDVIRDVVHEYEHRGHGDCGCE